MSKHTPGPWRLSGNQIDGHFVFQGDTANLIAWLHDGTIKENGIEDANARLIAAAPTLVAALEGLMEAVPAQTNDRDWWPDELTRAMAAARKALDEAGIEP